MSIPTDKERGAPFTASLYRPPSPKIKSYRSHQKKITEATEMYPHASGFPKVSDDKKNGQSARKPKYDTAPRIPEFSMRRNQ